MHWVVMGMSEVLRPGMKTAGVAEFVDHATPARLAPKSHSKQLEQPAASYQKGYTAMSEQSGRRINPDSRGTLWATVVLIVILGITSFTVSFFGLHDVAAWVGLPVWLRWAVPVFIDIAILAYSLAAVIHRSRGEMVWPTWLTLGVFTSASVVANGAHALAKGEGATAVQSWIGAGIAAMAPVAVFAATEQISRLAFLEPKQPIRAASGPEAPAELPEAAEPIAGAVPALPDTPAATLMTEPEAQPEIVSTVEDEPVHSMEAPAEPPEAPEAPAAEAGPDDEAPETTTTPATAPPEAAATPVMMLPPEVPEARPQEPEVPEAESDSRRTAADAPKDLAEWVEQQREQGKPVNGTTAAEFLGLSDRTGRARLTALRETHPHLFTEEA